MKKINLSIGYANDFMHNAAIRHEDAQQYFLSQVEKDLFHLADHLIPGKKLLVEAPSPCRTLRFEFRISELHEKPGIHLWSLRCITTQYEKTAYQLGGVLSNNDIKSNSYDLSPDFSRKVGFIREIDHDRVLLALNDATHYINAAARKYVVELALGNVSEISPSDTIYLINRPEEQ